LIYYRVQVKLKFLRMLVNMRLDFARMTLLTGFFETYLKLNEEEERKLAEELGRIDKKEAAKMMEITTSWQEKGRIEGKEEGRKEGIVKGQADLLIRQLKKKFTNMPADMESRVRGLSAEKLQQLAEAIFDLETLEDVKSFLS